jgi:hypothetical protein
MTKLDLCRTVTGTDLKYPEDRKDNDIIVRY